MIEQIADAPRQYDSTCYIVGGGSSLKNFDWSVLEGKFVIAINRAYEVLPSAQIVYFTDDNWYYEHKANLMQHDGLKIKGSLNPKILENEDIIQYHLTSQQGLVTTPGRLAHGHNSTYAAINLAAVHLGFKKIYLLGVDMKWGAAGNRSTSHWHDGHQRIDPETTYGNMMRMYETIAPPLLQMGVNVINVNTPEKTNLDIFTIQPPEKVFGRNCFTISEN